jgi:hypothetical protein
MNTSGTPARLSMDQSEELHAVAAQVEFEKANFV